MSYLDGLFLAGYVLIALGGAMLIDPVFAIGMGAAAVVGACLHWGPTP